MPTRESAAMRLSWNADAALPGHVTYVLDGTDIGDDDTGFDKLLSAIRSRPGTRVVVMVDQPGSLGGRSLIDSLPFKDRFTELTALLGPNSVTFEFA